MEPEIKDYWKTYREYDDLREVIGYLKAKTENVGPVVVQSEMLKNILHVIEYFYDGYEKGHDACRGWSDQCHKLKEKYRALEALYEKKKR